MDEIIYYKGKYWKLTEVENQEETLSVPADFPRRQKQFMNRLPGVPYSVKVELIELYRRKYREENLEDYETFLADLGKELESRGYGTQNAKPSKTAFDRIIKYWNNIPLVEIN